MRKKRHLNKPLKYLIILTIIVLLGGYLLLTGTPSDKAPLRPAAVDKIKISDVQLDKYYCYPAGDCYRMSGIILNEDSREHSVRFTIHFFNHSEFAGASSEISVDELKSNETRVFKVEDAMDLIFNGIYSEARPNIFGIDGNVFGNPLYCTKFNYIITSGEKCRGFRNLSK